MQDVIRIGRGAHISAVPAESWREHLAGAREEMGKRLTFMTPEHHLIRYTAVRELPRNSGRPLKPEDLSEKTGLDLPRVVTLLGELEQRLFFLVRNEMGEVSWAFPVTTDRTPHRLSFGTGERLFGA